MSEKKRSILKDAAYSFKKYLRRYLTASGKQKRLTQAMLVKRSEARKTLLGFVAEGEIDNLLVARNGTTLTMMDGRRYWWDPEDNVRRMFTVSTQGKFEAKEVGFLRSALSEGDIALDIGANFGWYTILFSQLVGSTGEVYAFEPIRRNFDILRENCNLNDVENVVLDDIAVGAENGEQNLYLPDVGSSGAFRLHQYRKDFKTFRCRVQTLDDYVAHSKISRIDLIKADIEGAELEMLHGATTVLQMTPQPIWLLEIQAKSCNLYGHTPKAVFDLMYRFGYSPYYISSTGILQPLLDINKPLPDYNFVFVGNTSHVPLEI